MTISATASIEMDVDRICKRALQLAGFLTPQQGPDDPAWISQSGMARDFLEADAEHLQAVGVLQRNVELYDLPLVAGTAVYELPSTTLDVLGVAMFQATGEDNATPVSMMDRDRYIRISDKTAEGRPTLYYPHKSAALSVYVWPVPTDAGTLQLQRYKAVATSTNGTNTMDFERSWTQYFVWSLAYQLSVSKGAPAERLALLKSEANTALAQCTKSATQQLALRRTVLAHRIGI